MTCFQLTVRELENLTCGIPLCIGTLKTVIVPEGMLVITPSWATEKLTIRGSHIRRLQAGEVVELSDELELMLGSSS